MKVALFDAARARVVPISLVALVASACSAVDPGSSDAPEREHVAQTSQPLLKSASGFARTPAIKNGTAYQSITCLDCTGATSGSVVSWSTIDTGDYLVKLPGVAPEAGVPFALHVSPFGTQGAECTINRSRTSFSGNDVIVGVSCTNSIGNDVNTRFQVSYVAQSAGTGAPANDLGFAQVVNNAFNGWYVSAAPGATLERSNVGSYIVRFPGLRQAGRIGNVQVTSMTKGKRCMAMAWDARTDTGVQVAIQCATTANVLSDADYSISFTRGSILAASNSGYVSVQDTTDFSLLKPPVAVNKDLSLNPDGTTAGIDVKRVSAGRYQLDFRSYGAGGKRQAIELSAMGNVQSSCVLMNADVDTAEVQCVKNGSPSNSHFSVRVGNHSPATQPTWTLISGINLGENYGLGWGVLCGQVAIELRQVMCFIPSDPGLVNPRITGPNLWPDNVRYVAVDNRDVTTTRVLVLGTDRVLRSTSGNLTQPWPASNNFSTVSIVAQPRFTPGDASLSLVKIVVTRDASSNIVLGLTSDNRVVELSGSVWVASSYPIPTGVTWKTITGGLDGLGLLATDGKMYRARRSASSATQLPTLATGHRAIGFGGDFIITNANANSSGLVPCVTPKDSQGYYNCGSTTQRFMLLADHGPTWMNVPNVSQIPLTNGDSVLTDGNPLTRTPSIEDARILHGDVGRSILTFHYNFRLYHFR